MRTPGKWWTMPDPSDGTHTVCIKGDGTPFLKLEFIGMRFEEEEANAKFIICACNLHDELVEALKTCVAALVVFHGDTEANIPETVTTPIGIPIKLKSIADEARAALEKAQK